MYDLNKAYSKKFFRQRKSLVWRAPIVVSAIQKILAPEAVVDVGCGNGDLVAEFRNRNIFAYGIEGTENALDGLRINPTELRVRDLRIAAACEHLAFVDLVICFEVAEHIEEEYVDVFVDNLCKLASRVLFSAAFPGQGGKHHVNCQSQEYWWYKFDARGYRFQRHVVQRIQNLWTPYRHKKGIKAYYQNLMYFEKIGV